jgi:hypothetical protein
MAAEAVPVKETAICTEAFQDVEVFPTKYTQVSNTSLLVLGWGGQWYTGLGDRWLFGTWSLSLHLQARLLATSILPIFLGPGPL